MYFFISNQKYHTKDFDLDFLGKSVLWTLNNINQGAYKRSLLTLTLKLSCIYYLGQFHIKSKNSRWKSKVLDFNIYTDIKLSFCWSNIGTLAPSVVHIQLDMRSLITWGCGVQTICFCGLESDVSSTFFLPSGLLVKCGDTVLAVIFIL